MLLNGVTQASQHAPVLRQLQRHRWLQVHACDNHVVSDTPEGPVRAGSAWLAGELARWDGRADHQGDHAAVPTRPPTPDGLRAEELEFGHSSRQVLLRRHPRLDEHCGRKAKSVEQRGGGRKPVRLETVDVPPRDQHREMELEVGGSADSTSGVESGSSLRSPAIVLVGGSWGGTSATEGSWIRPSRSDRASGGASGGAGTSAACPARSDAFAGRRRGLRLRRCVVPPAPAALYVVGRSDSTSSSSVVLRRRAMTSSGAVSMKVRLSSSSAATRSAPDGSTPCADAVSGTGTIGGGCGRFEARRLLELLRRSAHSSAFAPGARSTWSRGTSCSRTCSSSIAAN